MKKPGEMTVGLFAAAFAVASAMWIDTATAHDRSSQTQSTTESTTTAKKKKPSASDVSSGTAAEPSGPNKDPVDVVKESAKDVDSKFREGYGGSGEAGKGDGKTDMTDVGREAREMEERLEAATDEALDKLRGDGAGAGIGGSGDAGTGKLEVNLKTGGADAGTPSKVQAKLQADGGTR